VSASARHRGEALVQRVALARRGLGQDHESKAGVEAGVARNLGGAVGRSVVNQHNPQRSLVVLLSQRTHRLADRRLLVARRDQHGDGVSRRRDAELGLTVEYQASDEERDDEARDERQERHDDDGGHDGDMSGEGDDPRRGDPDRQSRPRRRHRHGDVELPAHAEVPVGGRERWRRHFVASVHPARGTLGGVGRRRGHDLRGTGNEAVVGVVVHRRVPTTADLFRTAFGRRRHGRRGRPSREPCWAV
jgi:hypothetical protein